MKAILDQRMKKTADTSKMSAMAKRSAAGNLTSFSGVFRVMELSLAEKEVLEQILNDYAGEEERDVQFDLDLLISLTSEVKAINNQAALLHGERIKKVHQMLTRYKDGAFTAWLMAAYGNRQTPYNFMQYYEFCEAMPKQLRSQIEIIPRQAVYVLASREGNFEKKRSIVENYQGETKVEMLNLIREVFPLPKSDKRQKNVGKGVMQELDGILIQIKKNFLSLSGAQKKQILHLTQQIQQLLGH